MCLLAGIIIHVPFKCLIEFDMLKTKVDKKRKNVAPDFFSWDYWRGPVKSRYSSEDAKLTAPFYPSSASATNMELYTIDVTLLPLILPSHLSYVRHISIPNKILLILDTYRSRTWNVSEFHLHLFPVSYEHQMSKIIISKRWNRGNTLSIVSLPLRR